MALLTNTDIRRSSTTVRAAIAFGDWPTTNALTMQSKRELAPNLRVTNLCERGKHDVCIDVMNYASIRHIRSSFICHCLCHNI